METVTGMAITKQKSANVSQGRGGEAREVQIRKFEVKDERVRRTRGRIDAAFVELLHRRGYGDIRVSDIVKKAGVGRPTFYAHYATKDELLRSQFERVVAPMLTVDPADSTHLDARPFFAHVQSASHFYRALMGPSGGTGPRVVRDCLEVRVRQLLALDPNADELKQAATARFVGSSITTIVECWLERGARETPQQVQTLFAGLVHPGLKGKGGHSRRED